MTESDSAADPGRSHHPVVDRAAAGEDMPLRSRRAAISELGGALRELVELAAAPAVPEDILRPAAAQNTRCPRPARHAPTAAPISPGCRTPIAL